MKFVKDVTPKGILLPVTAARLARFGVGERVEYHSLENTMVVLKGQMTAMELLTAAQSLQNLAVELCTHLAEVCDSCGGCEDCENICPYTDLDDEEIGLPNYLRQEAGIPEDAKLCAEVDEENHYVIISAAEHRYDLRDLPSELAHIFADAGACLAALEGHLILEDIVYGG